MKPTHGMGTPPNRCSTTTVAVNLFDAPRPACPLAIVLISSVWTVDDVKISVALWMIV